MKTFVLVETQTTVTTSTRRFTVDQYREYLDEDGSAAEIAERLRDDNGQYHDLIMNCPFGDLASDRTVDRLTFWLEIN